MQRVSIYLLIGILSLAAGAAHGQALQQDPGPDGIVSVEAENFDDNVPNDPHTWELITEAANGFVPAEGYSGGFAMQSTPTTLAGGAGINVNYAANSPRLDYVINFTHTGTHYVWVLGYGMDGNSDSLHSGLDGEEIATADRIGGINGNYHWTNDAYQDPERIMFDVPTTGLHTLNIWMREDGSVVDKIVLTTNPDYVPTGMGPAESSRGSRTTASSASPADGATDVPRDVTLGWEAGVFAASHDVYLGTAFDDVNNAGRANPMDVLLSQGQAGTTFDAGRLEFGQTYYWRVDEVNAAPDSTIYKGGVWSFTVEPLAYEILGVTATSNATSAATEGPENTVNGSGLNAQDEHSVEASDMWLGTPSGAEPTYLQYKFDRVYKLHELQVWNYNVIFELVLGFGVKDVTIEYSENGTDWMVLSDAEFAQATALSTYTANTTVDLGGVAAKYVRLTINSAWGPLGQYGLSEVRFLHVPAFAREPQPTDAETGVAVDSVLRWRAGREADVHEVYLGTDPNDLPLAGSFAGASVMPANLEFGTDYYWTVTEVNEAEAVSAWGSDVWSFQTLEFTTIEDFESYDDEDNRIYDTWLDGWVNSTGSTVGYFEAPFAERSIVNGGRQSMPLQFDNSSGAMYSEAEYDLGGMDLDTNGADTLRLFVAGQAPAFLETPDGSIVMNGIGTDIWNTADQFRFAYRTLTGDGSIVALIETLDGSPDPWVKGGVMIRETVDAGSTFGAVYASGANGVRYQGRLDTDASAVSDSSVATTEQIALSAPVWLKIERLGNALNGYYSTDGENWVTMAWNPQTIDMAAGVTIGLALTSHNASQATSAAFSNVSFTGNVSASWEVAEIGAVQPTGGNDLETVYVALEDSTGKVAVVSNPNAAVRSGWTEWLIPYSDLAGINLNNVATMYIGLGDRNNPKTGGAGTIFIDDIGYGSPLAE